MLFKKMYANEKGSVVILVALLMVVLLGFAALVIDVGGLFWGRRSMVTAADAGALAGAMEGKDKDREQKAKDYSIKNGAEEVEVDISGAIVTVEATKKVDFYFARILNLESSNVSAWARATKAPGNGLIPIGLLRPGEDEDWTFGDLFTLKYSQNWNAGLGPGNFGFLRLPTRTGVNYFPEDFGYGYDGDFPFPTTTNDEGDEETILRTEPGSGGDVDGGLEVRASSIDGDCKLLDYNDLTADGFPSLVPDSADEIDYYNDICPLIAFVPLVELRTDISPNNKIVEVVGYASFVLLPESYSSNDKTLKAYFIEELTESELINIIGNSPSGAVVKLIRIN